MSLWTWPGGGGLTSETLDQLQWFFLTLLTSQPRLRPVLTMNGSNNGLTSRRDFNGTPKLYVPFGFKSLVYGPIAAIFSNLHAGLAHVTLQTPYIGSVVAYAYAYSIRGRN